MAEILSQAEIDELINELAVGAVNEANEKQGDNLLHIKPYDFKTANRFPKEQIRTINIVFQNFTQLLANYFTGIFRVSCEMEVLSIEELTFNEFNNALGTPVVLAVFNAPPLDGSLLMQMSVEVVDAVIGRLLGGTSTKMDSKKTFTAIELSILERVIRQMFHNFDEAWTKVIKLKSNLERLETSSQFAQIIDLNEATAVVTINVRIGEDTGVISVCIPHMAIEPVAKQLNTRSWFSGTQNRKVMPKVDYLQKKVFNTSVPIYAVFNNTTATVSDIAKLQVGDVIQLEHKVGQPLIVKLQHIPKFHASIGRKGKKYAVKIESVLKGEDQ